VIGGATRLIAAFALAALAVPAAAESLTRGPYLQVGTPTSIVVRWRTDAAVVGRVRFGIAADRMEASVSEDAATTEHRVRLDGLTPATRYWYAVGSATGDLAAGGECSFSSAPGTGAPAPTRIWAIGDFGNGGEGELRVRDSYVAYGNGRPIDVWIMLGDNAYENGLEQEYQAHVFDVYRDLLRSTPVWPAIGNHDTAQDPNPPPTIAYFRAFDNPQRGEAGGVPSGTNRYYSFDHGNVHLLCLDSMTSSRAKDGAQAKWIAADLAATKQRWIIAYWHHAPYTKGSHDSDREVELLEMRQGIVPALEAGGCDLVVCGHSHVYERSRLIDGHYGDSSTFAAANVLDTGDGREPPYAKQPGPHHGTVYVVAGCAGKFGGAMGRHPAMPFALNGVPGSFVIDVAGDRLDAAFIDFQGRPRDRFAISKTDSANSVPSP
jgi:hypothetical protein